MEVCRSFENSEYVFNCGLHLIGQMKWAVLVNSWIENRKDGLSVVDLDLIMSNINVINGQYQMIFLRILTLYARPEGISASKLIFRRNVDPYIVFSE